MSLSPSKEILFHQFEEFRRQNYPDDQKGIAFSKFMTLIALREFPLSENDFEPGFTEGRFDGGVDGFHVILNKTAAISPETRGLTTKKAPAGVSQRVPLDLIIIQSKMDDGGWDSTAISNTRLGLEDLLNESMTEKDLLNVPLRKKLVSQVIAFRKYQKKLIGLDPVRSVTVYFMQPVDPHKITKPLLQEAKKLENYIAGKFPSGTKIQVHLCDVDKIEQMRMEPIEFKGELKFTRQPIWTQHGKSEAWLGMIQISDYIKFLSRDKGVLREEFFASNIRDFAGTKSTVNSAIRKSLETDSPSSFWWMNNGLTILADEARAQTDHTWTLLNPQIVNGLQTSNVIFEAAQDGAVTNKRKRDNLVVRVIAEKDAEIRESIIAGTNNQAVVGAIQLYANDEFQIELESYLRTKDWYYERRRWQYRNTNVPRSRIRTILQVAQASIALLLLRPDTARTRPGDRLKNQKGYEEVFSASYPIAAYSTALAIVDEVERYLATDEGSLISDDTTNDRYHLAVAVMLRALGTKSLDKFHVNQLPNFKMPDSTVFTELHRELTEFASVAQDKRDRDTAFKNQIFTQSWLQSVVQNNRP